MAKITLHQFANVIEVLLIQRPIQAHALDHRRMHGGVKTPLADHDLNRVTGNQTNQEKRDERDADESRDHAEQFF